MSTSFVIGAFREKVRKEAGHLMWLGGALTLIGVVALIFPMASTLVAALYVGWSLVFFGAATLFGAFSMRDAGPFFGALLLGLLSLAGGVFILARPIGGALAITLCLGAVFMIQGAVEAALAFELRPTQGWTGVLISAVFSILLSLLILAGWPGSSLVALGVVLGVNFISSGFAYLFLGSMAKRDAKA